MNNDRFKFRVWDRSHNKYIREYNNWVLNQNGKLVDDTQKGESSWSIDPDFEYIIEQCTGLKDKNGKLIYEGDIVHYVNKAQAIQFDYNYNGVIKFESTGFKIIPIKAGFNGWLTQIPIGKNSFEIISNIHENKE